MMACGTKLFLTISFNTIYLPININENKNYSLLNYHWQDGPEAENHPGLPGTTKWSYMAEWSHLATSKGPFSTHIIVLLVIYHPITSPCTSTTGFSDIGYEDCFVVIES